MAIWAPEHGRLGHRRAGRPPRRGGGHHREHPVQGRRGRPRHLHGPGADAADDHRLPRHRLRGHAGRGRRRPTASSRPSCSPGPSPTAPSPWADFLARGRRVDPATPAQPGPPPSTPTTSARSSSRRAPPGSPRAPCCATGPRCGRSTPGPSVVGLAEGDRYLIVNPFFHTFGLNAGILACLITGATIVPHPVFDVPERDAAGRRGAHLDAAGRAGDLPDDPRPPRPRPVRPVDPAPGGHRRGHGAGRDDPAHGVRAHVQDHRHGLRAHRVDRHRHDVPPHRRPRDHRQHGRPAHPRRRGAGRRRRRQGARRRASPARWSSGATT